jgi:hypothetical protein
MPCSIIFIGVPPARVRLNHVPGAEGRLLHQNGPKASFWASRDTRSGIPLPCAQMFSFLGKLCFLRISELLRKCLVGISWVKGGRYLHLGCGLALRVKNSLSDAFPQRSPPAGCRTRCRLACAGCSRAKPGLSVEIGNGERAGRDPGARCGDTIGDITASRNPAQSVTGGAAAAQARTAKTRARSARSRARSAACGNRERRKGRPGSRRALR